MQLKLVADDRELVDIQAIVDQVDTTTMKFALNDLVGVRHRTGNPTFLAETKNYIQQTFTQAGLYAYRDTFDFDANYSGENIAGRKAGTTDEDSAYYITAHFDTVNGSPGADDNGSAVAGMLEALRILGPLEFRKSLRFIGFDLEEVQLNGSMHFARNSVPAWEKLDGVVNLEMIGYYSDSVGSQQTPFGFNLLFPDAYNQVEADSFRGNFIINVGATTGGGQKVHRSIDSAAVRYVPGLKVISLALNQNTIPLATDLLRSDHASFILNGQPALMLTDGANFRNPHYHQPTDVVSTINFTFMKQVTQAAIGAICELADVRNATVAYSEPFLLDLPLSRLADRGLKPVLNLRVQPNPSEQAVRLTANLPSSGATSLRIVNLNGQLVWQQSWFNLPSGDHSWEWDGHDQAGNHLPNGVYIALLEHPAGEASTRIIRMDLGCGHTH
jgi:hypothetical protein